MTAAGDRPPPGLIRRALARIEDGASGFIGVTPADRVAVIDGMLRRAPADSVGYWLQLGLSMTIATLGLAMNSAAVVIGAMLISPLMQPLIDLGTGLATGSLLLSIRAGVRTASSVAVVVLGAAGLTRLLPFHEVTAELAARTSPTMIDLFIAAACALAAVYTTVRQGKDTISAAAGTAIGISLVPPLCTAGYGLGTGNRPMLEGALLLFTANFTAIITVTAVIVLLLGFGRVPLTALEDEILAGPAGRPLWHRAAKLTRLAVGRRLGVLTRLLIPAIMIGAIMIPLRRALVQVSWQVRTRSEVVRLLRELPGSVVRESLEVRAGAVRLRLFLVGGDDDARRVAATLRTRIAAVSGTEPLVEVVAVPDAATLEAMATQLRASVQPPAVAPEPVRPAPAVEYAAALDDLVARSWPAAGGVLVDLRTRSRPGATPALELEVSHLGPPLGAAGEELLTRRWSEALAVGVVVVDRALPTAPIEASADAGAAWLAAVAPVLEQIAAIDGLSACITVPAPVPAAGRRPRSPPPAVTVDVVREVLTALIRGRADVTTSVGSAWSLRVTDAPCAPAPTVSP